MRVSVTLSCVVRTIVVSCLSVSTVLAQSSAGYTIRGKALNAGGQDDTHPATLGELSLCLTPQSAGC
jgi:hypothetical protein